MPPRATIKPPPVAIMWKRQKIGTEEWLFTPVLLPDEIPPKVAAKFLSIKLSTIYRLIKDGLLNKRQASPGKMLLATQDVVKFKADTSKPGFWEKWEAANSGKIPSKLKKATR